MLRGVRMAWFTSLLLLDEDEAFAEIASGVPGLDPERLVRDLTAGAVEDAYEADRAEARSAAGIGDPAIAQDRAALFDGGARFTAPSLVFRHDGRTLVAGGFQSFEAYDVCVANLAPGLPRRPPPEPVELLAEYPDGLTTVEVAQVCRGRNDPARHRRHQGGAREPGRVGRDPPQRDRRCLEPLAARCLTGSSWCGTAPRPGTPRGGSRPGPTSSSRPSAGRRPRRRRGRSPASGSTRVMCSPLLRARATGEAIAAAAPGPPAVTIDERLREIDAGPFEGLTGAEIEAGPLAEEFHRWRSETDPVFPDGAETYESAVARARSFFGDVRDLPGTTLAATHGSLARVLVTAVILGIDPGLHRRMWLDHCHCAVVALDESPPRLVALNVDARNIGV